MFFSKTAIVAFLSLATTTTLAFAQEESYGGIYAREAFPQESFSTALFVRDAFPEEIYAREAFAEEYSNLFARKKGPAISVKLDKISSPWGSGKFTKAKAEDAVEAICSAEGFEAAVITHAWHYSGDSELDAMKHVTFTPTKDGRKQDAVHVYENGQHTQGPQGKGNTKKTKSKGKRSLTVRDVEILSFHRRNMLEAREAYVDVLEAIL